MSKSFFDSKDGAIFLCASWGIGLGARAEGLGLEARVGDKDRGLWLGIELGARAEGYG